MQTLSAMENIPTSKKEKPKQDIKIEDTIVFKDPYENEIKEREEQERAKEQERKRKEAFQRIESAEKAEGSSASQVGRYIDPKIQNKDKLSSSGVSLPTKPKRTGFGDFSSW